jgi:threonyl-tRNA synthetase
MDRKEKTSSTADDPNEKLDRMRHSAAHLMAAAIQSIWPEAKFGVGPTVKNGFYYDIDLPVALSQKDLEKIEKKMRELRNKKLPYQRIELPIEEAISEMERRAQPYKVELLHLLKEKGSTAIAEETGDADAASAVEGPAGALAVSFYRTGEFLDLCRGPHVDHSGEIGVFKLSGPAGA